GAEGGPHPPGAPWPAPRAGRRPTCGGRPSDPWSSPAQSGECTRASRSPAAGASTSRRTAEPRRAQRASRDPPCSGRRGLQPTGSWADPTAASSRLLVGTRELVLVGAATGQDHRAALAAQRDGLVDRVPEREPVREAGGEAVAAAVGVGDRPGDRRRAERPARANPAAELAGGGDDDPRLRLELTGFEPLGCVLP